MMMKKSNIEKEHELRRVVKESQKTHLTLIQKQEEAEQLRKTNKSLRDIL
jgi:hypothetical protein